MNLHILTFGIVRDILGAEKLTWVSDEPLTVMALKAQLIQKYPQIGALNSLLIAVNAAYAADNDLLSETDEIALIPPVSGG